MFGKLLLSFFFVSSPSIPSRVGIGIIAGAPTGISINLEGDLYSIDGALAWSIPERFHIHADYLLNFNIEREEDIPGLMRLYVGGGGYMQVSRYGLFLGTRIPFGVKYFFEDLPFDVFLEVVPGLGLIPETMIILQGGIGVRFYLSDVRITR